MLEIIKYHSKLFNSMEEYLKAVDDVIIDLSEYPTDNQHQIAFYKRLRNKVMQTRYKAMSYKDKKSLIRTL